MRCLASSVPWPVLVPRTGPLTGSPGRVKSQRLGRPLASSRLPSCAAAEPPDQPLPDRHHLMRLSTLPEGRSRSSMCMHVGVHTPFCSHLGKRQTRHVRMILGSFGASCSFACPEPARALLDALESLMSYRSPNGRLPCWRMSRSIASSRSARRVVSFSPARRLDSGPTPKT